jgi:FkbH-like protein
MSTTSPNTGAFPDVAETLLRKHKSLRRGLAERTDLLDTRIAVLGGSTTNEVVDLLELLLLRDGLRPTFYQSDYNKYFEEAVLDSARLVEFRPDIVFVHTSARDVRYPPVSAKDEDLEAHLERELGRYTMIWNSLEQAVGAVILQNNFDPPSTRLLGSMDAVSGAGRVRFANALNERFARASCSRKRLFINDLAGVASLLGQERFLDARRWLSYKLHTTPEGSLEVARSVAALVRAVYGRARKCLVLDLDNTVWGGIIGDDGPDKIVIGRETAQAEAYTAFQEYCVRLRERGILLAVCSKNTAAIAIQGFDHPDSVLRMHHFASFKANWEPKHENIKAIARELNIGVDSLVFVDDNPAERAIVSAQLPSVAVPNVGSDVTDFVRLLERERYFETVALSAEDMARADQYADNAKRAVQESRFADYGEYLDSLQMKAEIAPFRSVYLDRITQLTNKTNQYNLTTRRYTLAEIEEAARDPERITLFGRLSDAFGDNGLITVVIGRRDGNAAHIELWLMSCRVLKRDMEMAMLDELVEECQRRGIVELRGYYRRTPKNDLVADHYSRLGFELVERDGEDRSSWSLDLSNGYRRRNQHIKEIVHG